MGFGRGLGGTNSNARATDFLYEPVVLVYELLRFIELLDESEQFINKDTGFIEDISSSGVRVCAPQPPSETHLIRVIRPKVSMTLFALVRNRFRGRDGYHRLCAQLINGSAGYDEQM